MNIFAVFAGGIYQTSGVDYTLTNTGSGNWTLAFTVAPAYGPVSVLQLSAGGAPVTVTGTADGTNTTFSFTVPAVQTITFTGLPSTATYGAAGPYTLTATGGASGNPVTFAVVSGPASITSNTLTVTGAGTIIVAANQAGTSNYAAATQVTQTIVVNPAVQTYTISGTISGQGGNGAIVTLSGSANAATTASMGSFSFTGLANGTYTLAVSNAGYVFTPVSQIVIVNGVSTTANFTAIAPNGAGNCTITLQSVINLCATHADLLPLSGVGGFVNEPALSLCNDALSDLFTEPNDWKFNSVFLPMLVTTPNRQDYIFGGASAFTLGSSSSGACIDLLTNNGITEVGNTVTVNTTQPHRFKVGDTVYIVGATVTAYNSTFTDDGNSSSWSGGWLVTAITSTSFTFTHPTSGLATSGAPGIYDYGWFSEASMVEMNNGSSPANVRHLKTVKGIPVWSKVGDPEKVCVVQDRGDGTLLIRTYYVPGSTLWGINIVYQAKAPLKVSLTNTWAPIPDHYSAVYRQALIYRMYRYLNSPRADAEYQKLQQEINKAQGFDDNEETNCYLEPEDSLMDSSYFYGGF
jgi:hypothetical protein